MNLRPPDRRGLILAVLILAGLAGGPGWVGLPGPAEAHDRDAAPPDICVCETARAQNGWCAKCGVGYVAAVRVPSASLFDIMDPGGHTVNLSQKPCPTCHAAISSDGFCDRCHIGYVDGRAYLSPLAYLLALGEPVDFAGLVCDRCREHWHDVGWCDTCDRGIVGNVAYRDRALFDRAAAEHQRLLAALDRLDECEFCAVALFADGRCPKHNIFYRDLHEVSPE